MCLAISVADPAGVRRANRNAVSDTDYIAVAATDFHA